MTLSTHEHYEKDVIYRWGDLRIDPEGYAYPAETLLRAILSHVFRCSEDENQQPPDIA